jgi:hypothetical protein
MNRTKQISLALPEGLYVESKAYYEEYGYKNLQELILDLLMRKVVIENVERYKEIERSMRKSGRRMTQKEAVEYLKKL